ncbi:hypothetical protein MIR68_005487 [Amoeboaphelidium protococcarum]|nr:hypothetical protein MIR68_005487 [Amoeboaphelidium protococcarum]
MQQGKDLLDKELLLQKCNRHETLGTNYEVVCVISDFNRSDDYWHPAIVILLYSFTGVAFANYIVLWQVVPRADVDETMPQPLHSDQVVVKMFGSQEYQLHTAEELVKFSGTEEPYLSFKDQIPRLCQVRDVRMALDFLRRGKIPQYFKWRKWLEASSQSSSSQSQSQLSQSSVSLPTFGSAEGGFPLEEKRNKILPGDFYPGSCSAENLSVNNNNTISSQEHSQQGDEVSVNSQAKSRPSSQNGHDHKVTFGEFCKVLQSCPEIQQYRPSNSFVGDSAVHINNADKEESQKSVDMKFLYRLFMVVNSLGGYQSICDNALWPMVVDEFPELDEERVQFLYDCNILPVLSKLSPPTTGPNRKVSRFGRVIEKKRIIEVDLDDEFEDYEESVEDVRVTKPQKVQRASNVQAVPSTQSTTSTIRGSTADLKEDEQLSDLDFDRINLENIEEVRLKLKAMQAAQNSTRYENDFGYGVDYLVPPEEAEHYDVKMLECLLRKRPRASSMTSRVSQCESEPNLQKKRKAPANRGSVNVYGTSQSSLNRPRRKVRESSQQLESENSDYDAHSDMDDCSVVMDRFCEYLEPIEVTVQKERELEMFLSGLGTVDYDVKLSDEPLHQVIPVVGVYQLQMLALKQKFSEMKQSMTCIQREIGDMKKTKKKILQNKCNTMNLSEYAGLNSQDGFVHLNSPKSASSDKISAIDCNQNRKSQPPFICVDFGEYDPFSHPSAGGISAVV